MAQGAGVTASMTPTGVEHTWFLSCSDAIPRDSLDDADANTGLGNHGMETIQDFIARPDTQTSAVPEPASLLRLPLG